VSRIAAFAANAPLMSVPGAPAPAGGVGEWYRGAGGLRLRAGFWQPSGQARGTVILSPGRTEPIEKYYEVIGDFLRRGFCVLAHDWRGQGLSARLTPDRLKGHARAVEEFLDDYSRLLDTYEDRAPKPWILVGHSMGAALNLLSIENGESRAVGVVLSSPMLKIRTGKRSLWSARFAAKWNVNHGKSAEYVLDDQDDPFDHTFEKDALTTDAERYELWREQLYACPHLAVGGVTWGWLAFGIEVGDRALKPKALKKIRIPVSIVQSADDDRVWKQTNKWAAKRIAGCRYVEVPGAKHEVIMETDEKRQVFLDEFDALAEGVAPGQHVPQAPTVAVAPPVTPPAADAADPIVDAAPAPDFLDPPAPSPFAASFASADPAIIEPTPEPMPVEAAIEDAPEADPAALELSTSAPIAPDTLDVPANPEGDGPPPREVGGA
jgi:lysophospholipase